MTVGVAGIAATVVALMAWTLSPPAPETLRARAEAAGEAGDWHAALQAWRAVNQTRLARGRTYVAEARAALALDRAAQAEVALHHATTADPSDPEPWRLLLELLRVEDRAPEAMALGWSAYDAVAPAKRRGILRDLTLVLLADLPEDLARRTLDRWIHADPDDIDARVARLRRIAASPRSDDPDRNSRISTLASIVERHPRHLGAREALIVALADAGDPDGGRRVLEAWPDGTDRHDLRYLRLRGRWDLDYDHQPERAVEAFQRVIASLPSDWKTYYRLARALRVLGRTDEANQAAETVSRLREVLDPATLGPRLAANVDRLNSSRSLLDLATVCARAGLTRLADAWRLEAAAPAAQSEGLLHESGFGHGTIDIPLPADRHR